MEFISNLIKRPISLVLSDSAEVSSASSSPSAQLRERCIVSSNSNNNVHNIHKNNIINNIINNNKNNMNTNNNSTIHDAGHEGSRSAMLPLIVDVGAGGDGLHTGHCDFEHAQMLNSSTSSNSTSSTIEELLSQINDNLNQASLQDNSDNNQVAANEMSSGVALSPLAAKSSSTHKQSQSQHPQTPTTPTVFIAPPSPNVAAGSAVFEINTLKIDSDIVTGNLDKTHLVLNNNNTGAAKRNKFVGLTEFDESNFPELPECLNPNIGEQLKLTFDEDLIPTLTASSNAQLRLPNKRDDATKTLQVISNETDTALSSDNETYAECQSFPDLTNTTTTIDLGYGENNTSLSEADAYRSALNSYNNTTIGITNDDEIKQLDETLENVADIGDEIFEVTRKTNTEQSWHDMMSTKNQNELIIPHNATFDGNDVEPMDVDLNETHELAYTTNVTMEADRLHAAGDAALINELERECTSPQFKDIPEQKGATSLMVALNAKGNDAITTVLPSKTEPAPGIAALKDVPDHQRPTFSVGKAELPSTNNASVVDNNAVDLLNQEEGFKLPGTNSIEIVTIDQFNQVESVELPGTNSIEAVCVVDQLNKTKAMTVSNDAIRIQDNSVDSATDAMPSIKLVQEELQVALNDVPNPDESSSNHIISSSVAEAPEPVSGDHCEKDLNSTQPLSSLVTAAGIERKLNLTLDINTSFEPTSKQQTSSHSPSFPIKSAINTKYFPRSPDVSRPMIFLEKSDYSVEDVLIVTPSKKVNATKMLPTNLNKTIDVSDAVTNMPPSMQSPLSTSNRSASDAPKITNLSSSSLNCTFDGANSLPSPTMTSSTTELQTASADDKSRTFKASSTPMNSELENSLNSSHPNSRLTFNVPETEKINSTPSPKMTSSVKESEVIATDKRRTFIASPTPNSQLDNSLNSSRPNSRLTFNVSDTENMNSMPSPAMTSSVKESEVICTDKRRTFNASPAPNSQFGNSLNSSQPNSCFTFNVPEPEEPVCNQSFEAMDVDNAMHASPSPKKSYPSSPRISSSVTCSNSSPGGDLLSAKEQTKSNAKDEKDIFVEKFSPSAIEDMFKSPSLPPLASFNRMSAVTSRGSTDFADSSQMPDEFGDEDFQNNLILNPSDFDYLLTKGNSNVQVDRSSLLLRFDPLLGVPIPVNQPQQQQQQLQQILANNNLSGLSPTLEEEEHLNDNCRSFVIESGTSAKPKVNPKQFVQGSVQGRQPLDISQEQVKPKKNARMSVDVIKDMKIENDCNKSIENSNTQSDDIQNNFKMDELEKKIKNEVLKTEDIEKKLKEAEQREEALIKRITEKDKTIAKMNGVIEAYEKAIAELISEKEQLIQSYEKQLTEVKADRDSNYHHLTSLETTFSDLHVKYEKSKEMTSQLKSSEESLLSEKKQNLENLRLQEQRYEKMKNHAMQQLEIANKKLESLTKEHAIESTKLKALLKKEEISRASINEQLQQKSRENAELVKICDELINGQGS